MGVRGIKEVTKMVKLLGGVYDECAFKVSVPEGRSEAPKDVHLGTHLLRRIYCGQFYVTDGTKSIFVIDASVFRGSLTRLDGPLLIKVDDSLVRVSDTDEVTRLIDAMNMTNIRWSYDGCHQWNKVDDAEAQRLSV